MSSPLVKSAAVATAKTACCAVIGIAGGHIGMLALGAFGLAAAIKPTEEILKFAIEKSSEILAEIGIESLGDGGGDDPLRRVFREALRKALVEIRAKASEDQSFFHSKEKKDREEIETWFKNWDRALEAPVLEDFDRIPLGDDTTEEADRRLRDFLAVLNAQGKRRRSQGNASLGIVVFQPGAFKVPPPELVDLLKKELPTVLPPIFDELLTSERNNQANKQYVNKFIDKFKKEYGPAIEAIKETVDSIKQDTALIPGIGTKVDILIDRMNGIGPSPKRKPSNLPFASLGPLFKGREGDLKELEGHSAAAIVQPASITGLGGIGKTRLAIEYALRNEEKFSALLYVRADTPQELETNLALLSSPFVLSLPAYESGNQAVQYAAVLGWLQTERGWLLILDNADTRDAVKAVQKLLPVLRNGQVLVTSRIAAWGASIHALGLHLLSEEAAISYLLDRTVGHRKPNTGDEGQAALLSEDLGRLALALEQAAAYVNAKALSLAKYRALWQAKSASLIGFHDELAMDYPMSVAVTLQTTIDGLSPDSKALLNILAWLAPDPIPRSLLSVEGGPFAAESEEGLPEDERPAAGERAEAALDELALFSLASRTEDKEGFSIHRLVQALVRRNQPKDEQRQWVEAALRLVNAGFPFDSGNVRFWPVAEALAPHARGIAEEADRRGISEPTSRLIGQLGVFYQSRAEWDQAELAKRRALAINEKSYGSDHPQVAIHLNNLASLLQGTNRLAEAEPLMRRALAIDEKSYGSDHPQVAIHLNNLAQLLQDTNRLAEAEPLMRRALAINEKSYGKDHPSVAIRLNNLASLLQGTNRLAEAEPLMRRALAINEKSYGKEHPSVAIRLNNLAQLLQDTNRLAEAEPLMRRALEIDEKSYGKEHPDVAIDLNNLASLLQATNRLAEAEPLKRRALEIDEKSYGKEHPLVAIRLNNLARLLQATDRLAEAEPPMRRALAIDEKSYGSDHPDVAIDLNNLAQLLQDTDRLAEAEPLMRRALEIDEKSYGKEHPNVAIRLNNLARLLQATDRLAEAEPPMRRVVDIFLSFTRSTGHQHPHLQAAVNNYAGLLLEMGWTREQVLARLREMAPEFFS